MSDLVSESEIERIVGIRRHRVAHYGRAISEHQTMYILHSEQCKNETEDLRQCRFSVALDRGLDEAAWAAYQDVTVAVGVWGERLIPLPSTVVRHGDV